MGRRDQYAALGRNKGCESVFFDNRSIRGHGIDFIIPAVYDDMTFFIDIAPFDAIVSRMIIIKVFYFLRVDGISYKNAEERLAVECIHLSSVFRDTVLIGADTVIGDFKKSPSILVNGDFFPLHGFYKSDSFAESGKYRFVTGSDKHTAVRLLKSVQTFFRVTERV